MACITSLEQTSTDGSWEGKDIRTNRVYKFKTLADYRQYTKSLEVSGKYCPPVTPIHNTQYTPSENRQFPIFMEFLPRDPAKQAKYSAMSPSWEGLASSESAIARGDYDLDMQRGDRAKSKPTPLIADSMWNCSIQ